MDGEIQSDSSSESGSESSGQGTSAEVLQALESLTQKVDELNEKVGNTESSLGFLRSEVSELKSTGGISGIKFGENKSISLGIGATVSISIESGTKAILFGGRWASGGVEGEHSYFHVYGYSADRNSEKFGL